MLIDKLNPSHLINENPFLNSENIESEKLDLNSLQIMASVRIKVVIVGDLATAKTSLLEHFETGQFHDFYQPTIFRNLFQRLQLTGKW